MPALAEGDQPSGSGRHVPARKAEREGRDGEVHEQVDAGQVGLAHRVAVRALVERTEWWRGSGDHVRDACAATPYRRCETECFLVGLLPDRVGEDDATAVAGIDLTSVKGRLCEFLRGRV